MIMRRIVRSAGICYMPDCLVTKLIYPAALDIVGVATETGIEAHRSEDLVYYDARTWDAKTGG